jgi:hypothetical protein
VIDWESDLESDLDGEGSDGEESAFVIWLKNLFGFLDGEDNEEGAEGAAGADGEAASASSSASSSDADDGEGSSSSASSDGEVILEN